MFAVSEETIDHALERRREACRRRLGELCEQAARIDQEVTELVREADDRGDWQTKLAGELGTASSHGCIRVDDPSIRWTAAHIAPGVPVGITR